MDSFPLNPFLTSLAADGIRPTIGDYERISVALRAEGPWTITRFRDVLLALTVSTYPERLDEDLSRLPYLGVLLRSPGY